MNGEGYAQRTLSKRLMLWDAARTAWSQRRRVHVVNGIWAEVSFVVALLTLMLAGGKFVIYSEAPDPTFERPRLKRLVRAWFGRWVARNAAGLLAISHFAAEYFTGLGFPGRNVYPFGYFRAACGSADVKTGSGERIEIVFVGQLVHRKGVDILLEAMSPLFGQHPGLVLTVIGAGDDLHALRERAESLGVGGRVVLEGVVPSDEIQSRLKRADALVLPSRWDGWGLVINEALSVGVPVIASNQCGAADLIQHGVNGYVFRSEDVEDLRACLRSFLKKPADLTSLRKAAADTGRVVSAEAVAPYMIECLKHVSGLSGGRPAPPWASTRAQGV
jgi:glycosyltransferase involved in cell wall biosynthesis